MNQRKRNNIIIGVLCCALIFMGVGYAILSTTLNIGGTAKITGDFDIHFTNVQRSTSTISDSTILSTIDAGTGITANTGSQEASFTAVLQKPTDYVIYEVSVANTGTIDGYLTFSFEDTNSNFDYYKDFYSVEFIRDDVNPVLSTDILQPDASFSDPDVLVNTSGTRTYKIKVTYKSTAESFPDATTNGAFGCTMNLTYSQQAPSNNQQVVYVDQDDSCFISFRDGEINYYDTSKQGCGTSVTIPDNLRLKTSTLTGYTFNNQLCIAFAPDLRDLFGYSNISNQQFCSNVESNIANLYSQGQSVLYDSFYSGFITPTYTTPQEGTYNLTTKIGAASFGARNLTSISLSNNITEIKESAFISDSLTTLTIPNSVTSIANYAFMRNSLTSVNLGNGVTSIGNDAFLYNQISGTLTIPASVETIGIAAFNTNQIQSITFASGSNLTSIGQNAFRFNSLTGTLKLPSNLETIGNGAFSASTTSQTNNNNITGLDLSEASSLTSIGSDVFSKNHLGQLDFSGATSLTTINDDAFWNCGVTGVNFGTTVTTILDGAFGSNSITSLVFPSSITTIGYQSFVNQYNDLNNNGQSDSGEDIAITNVVINNWPTTYVNNAFSPGGITNLTINAGAISGGIGCPVTTLTLGSGVTSIADNMFNVGNLTSITVKMSEADWNSNVTLGNNWKPANVTPVFDPN